MDRDPVKSSRRRGPSSSTGLSSELFLVAVVALGVLVLAAWYLHDPEGSGGTAMTATFALSALVMAGGPVVRGMRPRSVWWFVPAAGLLLFASVFDDHVEWRLGPFEYSDLMFLPAYGMLIVWLVLLSRLTDQAWDKTVMLDAAAACTGGALAVWTAILAPLATRDDLVTGLIWTLYPPLDVVLLVLAIHLATRIGRVPPPLAWFVVGVALWVVTDFVYAALEYTSEESWDIPLLEVGYVITHVSLAVALIHPRVGDLIPPPRPRRDIPRAGRHGAVLLLTVVPAVVSAAVPEFSTADRAVRTVLLTVLLLLLFVRLSRTMIALSRAESESRYRAGHDALTGLANRAALYEALDTRLHTARARGLQTVLVFIDCDDFKRINDTWGHHAGDTLLRDVAAGLREAAGPTAVVARQGGDEFVVLDTVRHEEEAEGMLARLQGVFSRPMQILPDRTHPAAASFGFVVVPPEDPCSTEEIVGRADAAMYAAKRQGKGLSVRFGPEHEAEMRRRAIVGDRLGQVIDSGSLDVVLQPIMGGPGYGTLLGWEALARWEDEELGDVGPEVFIPVAEDLGLVGALGESVLRQACVELRRLRDDRPGADLAVAVNVSPSQLFVPDFVAMVARVLEETGLPGRSLRLEVTETALVDPGSPALRTLTELRDLGVWVCVDDFGTGYAAPVTLMQLPVDCVKIDRSLITRVADDPAAERRLAAVLGLVRSLGIEAIVAEGVETSAQAEVLSRLGCPSVQGWFFGRPIPVPHVPDPVSVLVPERRRVPETEARGLDGGT